MSGSYPCPCCGHLVLDDMPGSYEICPVYFWEDDGVQFRWPATAGGANKVSLIEAQRNYQDFGACDQHGRRYVRPPAEDEPLDPAWRPTSYDARAELIDIGSDTIPAIIDGLPSLGSFGQLTAIEVFEGVADPRCSPALIALLGNDDSTVREWAAMALAGLKIDGAAEPVRRAYRACLERATPPDWSEPVGVRWALTELGARIPVVPPLTVRLRATVADNAQGWPSTHFPEIINDLADHAQVILYSQVWQVDAGRTYGASGTGLDWELDWTAPWEHLVEESRTWSLLEASEAPTGDNILVAPHLDRPYRPVPGEVTDAVPAPRGDRLRLRDRALCDEEGLGPPALPRPEKRSCPAARVATWRTLRPSSHRRRSHDHRSPLLTSPAQADAQPRHRGH